MTSLTVNEEKLKEPADFALEMDVAHAYDTKNADGSNPRATLKVESSRMDSALYALNSLGEAQANSYLGLLIDSIAVKIGIPEDVSYEDVLSDPNFADAWQNQDWVTVSHKVTVEMADGAPVDVTVTMTAPSYRIAYGAFQGMTTPARLNNLMASFVTEKDDDDSDY